MKKIDTHQHLLYPDIFEYPWLGGLPALQGSGFGLEGYRTATKEVDIVGTVFMEVDVAEDQSGKEAAFFCRLAEDPAQGIRGVVASGRPESEHFESYLDSVAHPALKGIRRVLHTQDNALSQSQRFRSHVAALARRDLTFDMCFLAKQLPLAMELADACPDTRLMLDHCGVPPVAEGMLDPWKGHLRELSQRPHVFCKLSGLVAYAQVGQVTVETLRPWVDHALACFGAERLVWGGDWPVCNLTSSLKDWVSLSENLLADLSETERQKIFFSNALEFYKLSC
jgi:predicted TIM-barrel fold metal-dependent hydrolase